MINEELKAKYESLNSMEDAYAMMKENGYTGTLEDFEALCAKAAEEIGPMELDAMDEVAGGISWEGIKEGASDLWDATKSGFNKGVDWVKANPELTASIAGGVAVAAIGVTVGVKAYSASRRQAAAQAPAVNQPYQPFMNIQNTVVMSSDGENAAELASKVDHFLNMP